MKKDFEAKKKTRQSITITLEMWESIIRATDEAGLGDRHGAFIEMWMRQNGFGKK